MSASSRSRLRRPVVVLSAAALLLGTAACGGDDGPEAGSDDATTSDIDFDSGVGSEADAPADAASWPLTGQPLDGDLPDYPVMAVKIDNSSDAEPQVGLSDADVVTQELVEGGITRLNAFYYSAVPELVGPVRSIRTSDIGIVKPAEAVLVAAGAANVTRGFINGANITSFNEGAPGYERDADRVSPHNLMVRLPDLADSLKPVDPPPPYLPFGPNEMTGAEPAEKLDVAYSGIYTSSFTYEGDEGYVRSGSYAADGDDFVADTVLVLRVKEGDAGYLDPAGNPVPATIYEGTGPMLLLHAGSVIEGTWSKDEPKSVLELATRSGDPVTVPSGNTWIELAPRAPDGGSVSIG